LASEELDGAGRDGGLVGDAAIRITVSRGPLERRGLLPAGSEDLVATVAIQCWPYVPTAAALLEDGVRAVSSTIRRDPSSPLAGVKTTSRADYVFARLEAARASADDALFLTLDGRISEATAANLFVIAGATLATPPLTAAILAGTTRTWLLGHAERLGLDATEVDLQPVELLAADEAFLTGSVAGIVPLVALDGRPVGSGRPGPRTRALRAAREDWIDAMSMAALLPELPD
ncbi:MAG: aminotransferase class IV, partial [Candidatus Limnocylindrales bacterium]